MACEATLRDLCEAALRGPATILETLSYFCHDVF